MKSLIAFVTVRKCEIGLRKDEQDRSLSLLSTLHSKCILLYLSSLYILFPIVDTLIHLKTQVGSNFMQTVSNVVAFLVLWVILFNKNITCAFRLFFAQSRFALSNRFVNWRQSRKTRAWYPGLTNVAHFSIENEIVKRAQSYGYRNEKSRDTIYYAIHMTDAPSTRDILAINLDYFSNNVTEKIFLYFTYKNIHIQNMYTCVCVRVYIYINI